MTNEELDKVLAERLRNENMTINSDGGKQHKVAERCEALFPRAILEVAKLRKHGHDVDGYEDDNYRNISPKEHIGRAMRHLLLWMAGDAEDGSDTDHLTHACCRVMMALEEILTEKDEIKEFLEEFRYGKQSHTRPRDISSRRD